VLELLPRYIKMVETLSEKYDAKIVRLQDIFQRQLAFRDAEDFCPEPVHPNRAGHLVIAEALMGVLGG
jgi:lysophospholipase L1-like esterase